MICQDTIDILYSKLEVYKEMFIEMSNKYSDICAELNRFRKNFNNLHEDNYIFDNIVKELKKEIVLLRQKIKDLESEPDFPEVYK